VNSAAPPRKTGRESPLWINDRGAIVVGAQLSGSYGLLDGTFAR
jgi:hypothetical protein